MLDLGEEVRQMGATRLEDMRKRQQEAAVAIRAAKSTEQKQLAQIKGLEAAIVEEQLKQRTHCERPLSLSGGRAVCCLPSAGTGLTAWSGLSVCSSCSLNV